jgi:hypothetical protein
VPAGNVPSNPLSNFSLLELTQFLWPHSSLVRNPRGRSIKPASDGLAARRSERNCRHREKLVMLRSIPTIAVMLSMGFTCVQSGHAADPFRREPRVFAGRNSSAQVQPQKPIQMGPLVVTGNRPTRNPFGGIEGSDIGTGGLTGNEGSDAPDTSANGFPSQAENDAFVKKISKLVGQHGSAQVQPQKPIQMGPLVVTGNRPTRNPSNGLSPSQLVPRTAFGPTHRQGLGGSANLSRPMAGAGFQRPAARTPTRSLRAGR